MIFYFSGTGNSFAVAKKIASHHGEGMVSMAAAVTGSEEEYAYSLAEAELIAFVLPVYAWGPPRIVLEFVQKLKLHNFRGNYVFAVVTCGDNIGNAMQVLAASLGSHGIALDSGFTIKMPNNYIIMGDVDKKEVVARKLLAAEEKLQKINGIVEQKEKGVFELDKGPFPWLLTGLLNPMFNSAGINTAKYHADDSCTGCGTCEQVCNCNNIKVTGKPGWGNRCSHCLACIHYCPAGAVQYGRNTRKKGRYTNPEASVEEIVKAKTSV